MKRAILLATIWIGVCGMAQSQQMYLQEGLFWTEWDRLHEFPELNDGQPEYTYHSLWSETLDGERVLREYVSDSPETKGEGRHVIKVADQKVYLQSPLAENGWGLLYDFSVAPGEEIEVMLPYAVTADQKAAFLKLHCLSIVPAGDGRTQDSMEMIETKVLPWQDTYNKGYWMHGLGNTLGIFHSSAFNASGCMKGDRTMISATFNGMEIYHAPMAGIKDSGIDNDGVTRIYDLNGREIKNLAIPGLYIKVKEGQAIKVLIHP